jgi:type III secretion protein C
MNQAICKHELFLSHRATARNVLLRNNMKILNKLILALALIAPLSSYALGNDFWETKKFTYRSEGKKLPEVLQDFAASLSVPVIVEPGVDGLVNINFNGSASNFLKAVSKTYNVIWYFDGVTLYVYPSSAMQSQMFRMQGYDKEQVREMLTSFGLGDSRFQLRYNEAEKTMLVYGPPRHIELVGAVIDSLQQGSRERNGFSIKVVPLRYAVAADRKTGSDTIVGLATTLNNVYGGGRRVNSETPTSNALNEKMNAVFGIPDKNRSAGLTYGMKSVNPEKKMQAMGKTSKGNGDKNESGTNDHGGNHSTSSAPSDKPEKMPFFEADEATNSIIINGPSEKMRMFEALVRQLDVVQDLVEIEVSIIDVSTDEFNSLGIEWDYTRAGGRGSISVSPGTPRATGGAAIASSLGSSNITTLVADAGRQLLTRIRALEGSGKARIIARPKVLGAANHTATMVDKRIASIRVAGNLDANLFTIEAGTTLQVLPQIISYADRREVKLTLSIEDGNFETIAVDQIPVIKRTEIRTQATVGEGTSLLIGGISVETDSKTRSGLPGLSQIPILGALFRHDEVSKFRSERLFLITPKVINVEGSRIEASMPSANLPAAPAQVPLRAPVLAPTSTKPLPTPLPLKTEAAPPIASLKNNCVPDVLGVRTTRCNNSIGE